MSTGDGSGFSGGGDGGCVSGAVGVNVAGVQEAANDGGVLAPPPWQRVHTTRAMRRRIDGRSEARRARRLVDRFGRDNTGWGLPEPGCVTFATFNSGKVLTQKGDHGERASWLPFTAALPSMAYGLICGLTEVGLKGIVALGIPARIVPDYSFHYNGEGANAALIVSNRFASNRLSTARLFRDDPDVRSDYKNAVAVHITEGALNLVCICIYINPATSTDASAVGPPPPPGAGGAAAATGQRIWIAALKYLHRVVAAVRNGEYGAEAQSGHIVVMGDLNVRMGPDARGFIEGWRSEETREPAYLYRPEGLADFCAQFELRPVNDFSGRAGWTNITARGRSVVDYIIMDDALRSHLREVRLIGRQVAQHSADPLVHSANGHQWLEAMAVLPQAPVGEKERRPVGDKPGVKFSKTTRAQRFKYARLYNEEVYRRQLQSGAPLSREELVDLIHECEERAFPEDLVTQQWQKLADDEMWAATHAAKRALDRVAWARGGPEHAVRYAEYRTAEKASKRVLRGRAWEVNQEGRAAVFNKKRTSQKDLWDSIYFQLNGTAPPIQPVAPVRRAADGKLTVDGKQRAAEFRPHFSKLGCAVDPQDPDYNVLRGLRVRAEFERIVTACSAHASFGRLDDPITAA